jgi:hypothetical protein
VERPSRRRAMGRGGARNRLLARLPKPALVSNRKALQSTGAFSRTMSAPGGRRHTKPRAGGPVMTHNGSGVCDAAAKDDRLAVPIVIVKPEATITIRPLPFQ